VKTENMRPELEPALTQARTLEPDELPRLLGDLEEIRTTALARLAAPIAAAPPDELLDVPEAAQRLSMSQDYLYRHHRQLPFTRRVGRKLLFSSAGIAAYLKRAR
jgi:predicted DNA-binding transcriptional regulator AlpA